MRPRRLTPNTCNGATARAMAWIATGMPDERLGEKPAFGATQGKK